MMNVLVVGLKVDRVEDYGVCVGERIRIEMFWLIDDDVEEAPFKEQVRHKE
jgi:hypothetical protein